MKTKVQGGTAEHGINLCNSCYAATSREDSDGQVTVKCGIFRTLLRKATVKCSAYQNVNLPDLMEMKQMAWIITPQEKGKMGFRHYGDLSDEEKFEVLTQ